MKNYILDISKYHQIEAHESIQFDLHLITIYKTDIELLSYHKEEGMMYMKKYNSKSYILDFYKSNSNIINNDFE